MTLWMIWSVPDRNTGRYCRSVRPSFGDSPYQSFSTYAGNPYFIDLDLLIEEGLLQRQEVEMIRWYEKEDQVSYELLWEYRYSVLKAAFERSDP